MLRKISYYSSKLMLSLVNDLVDLFTIKNNTFVPDITEFNLLNSLNEVMDL